MRELWKKQQRQAAISPCVLHYNQLWVRVAAYVSISAIASPADIEEPATTFHFPIVPTSIVGERAGIFTTYGGEVMECGVKE